MPTSVRVPLSFKKHILPPLGGLGVALLVFGVFNSQYLSGRVAYAVKSRDHSAIARPQAAPRTPDYVIDANAPAVISIPKIDVHAPTIYSQQTVDEKSFQIALRDGVVHYPQTALPGQPGNVVLFGHSSGQWWARGDYKFVFSLLDKLTVDDLLYIDYSGIRYTYKVSASYVVLPDNVQVLTQNTDEYKLTLITCTPVSTNTKRLIIEAKQISPTPQIEPATDAKPHPKPPTTKLQLPGNTPSLWQDASGLF